MNDLIFTLLGGMLVIVVGFLLLNRFSRLSGKASSVVVALFVSVAYPAYTMFNWPGADIFSIHIAVYLVLAYILGIISAQRDMKIAAGENPELRIHWAPATIVSFFLFIVVADSFFVMFATKGMDYDVARWLLPTPQSGAKVSSNFPGTVGNNFQEKEDQYNNYQKQVNEQTERNWQINKGWLGEARAGQASMFRVNVHDKNGEPIEKAAITGSFMRPGNMQIDQQFRMEEKAPGDY